MKITSLTMIPKELGISASYLSQVNNSKRPASVKVLSKIRHIVKQNIGQSDKIVIKY
jgi:hypothetical protein